MGVVTVEDLIHRIKRVHNALDNRKKSDLSDIKPIITKDQNGYYVEVSFSRDDDQAELDNKVNTLIGNIAKIKDHLKQHCKLNDIADGKEIEQIIDTSPDMKIIITLDNIDKHGLPLRGSPRCEFIPILKNIKTLLALSTGTSSSGAASITFGLTAIKANTSESGNASLIINGDIYNEESGQKVATLLDTCSKAIALWESTLKSYGIM